MPERKDDRGGENGELDHGVQFHPMDSSAIEQRVDLVQRDEPDRRKGHQREHAMASGR